MKIILVRLYYLNKVIQVSLVSLVKFFRLDYIDSIFRCVSTSRFHKFCLSVCVFVPHSDSESSPLQNDQDWSGMIKTGQDWSGMIRTGQDWSGMIRSGKE